jgi:dimethylamine/trimethylamine dehydrogenase
VWDLIGAARPNIADPFIPEKIRTGRVADIRACIGCNMCISKGDNRRHIGCTQNATAGEEHRRGWHPERFDRAGNADREVLVVGAGPAGMECALVLGRRGMRRVRLLDAAPEPGGITRWIPRLPGLREWDRLRTWRLGQLARLANVEIETGVRIDAAAARAAGADIVVAATGAAWAGDGRNGVTRGPIPGADASLPHVLTPEQIMLEGRRPPGRRAIVLDCEGYFMGAGMAELLRADGYEVELVTSCEKVAPMCDETLEGPLLRRHLHDLGIGMRAETWLTAIEPGGAACETELGDTYELEADAVVLVTQRVSDERLYLELAAEPAGIERVLRVGDCVAPRLLADAIWDGHRLGREIDSPDPSIPLPHLRERPGLEADPPVAAVR